MRSQIRKRVRNIMPSWYKDRIPQFTISWYPPVRIIKLPKGLSVAASLLIAQLNCLVRCFMSNCCHNHQILDEAVMQQILSVFILNCKSMNLHSSMHMHESELLDMPLLIHRLGPTEGFPLTECNFLLPPPTTSPKCFPHNDIPSFLEAGGKEVRFHKQKSFQLQEHSIGFSPGPTLICSGTASRCTEYHHNLGLLEANMSKAFPAPAIQLKGHADKQEMSAVCTYAAEDVGFHGNQETGELKLPVFFALPSVLFIQVVFLTHFVAQMQSKDSLVIWFQPLAKRLDANFTCASYPWD